jgi:predicted Zn-dependent protease
MAAITSVGAQVAGAFGVIDQNTANAISQSAQAIGRAAEEITPEQEYYIGRAVGANILVAYKIYNGKPELTAYLNQICRAITINSPKPFLYNGYHVNILDTDEINAFATSGGHIFLTLGLIACADSEDALAGVISHEIAHIQLQHGIKSIRNSRITQALIVTGTSAVGAVTGMDVQELTSVFNESIGEIITTMVNNGYSQTQEFEADATALSLMAAAGYDPQGLMSMLRILQQNQRDTTKGFGKTHPTPAQRITNAQISIGQYRVLDTKSYRVARYNLAVR